MPKFFVDGSTGDVSFYEDTGTTAKMYWDASAESLGIGTSSPNTNFVVLKNGSLATHAGVSDFTASFQNTDNTSQDAIVGITSSTSGSAKIHFGDTGNVNVGVIDYDNSDNSMRFSTNATEAMRIDTSGNLLFNSGYGSVATAYGCRAWVNFNGTGTVAIRESGNVSSITDVGTGNQNVNFTTAMPDANYATVATSSVSGSYQIVGVREDNVYATTAVRINTLSTAGSSTDSPVVSVAIFR